MKRFLLIGAFAGAASHPLHAQMARTMLEQLAELKLFQHTLQDGYNQTDNNLNNIGDIREAEFQDHQAWIASQSSISPSIKSDPKLQALLSLQTTLVMQIKSSLDYWTTQRSLQQ